MKRNTASAADAWIIASKGLIAARDGLRTAHATYEASLATYEVADIAARASLATYMARRDARARDAADRKAWIAAIDARKVARAAR